MYCLFAARLFQLVILWSCTFVSKQLYHKSDTDTFSFAITCGLYNIWSLLCSAVAGQNVFFFFLGGGGGGRGRGNLAERNLGGPEENRLKFFEIFIFKNAANVSNFKN